MCCPCRRVSLLLTNPAGTRPCNCLNAAHRLNSHGGAPPRALLSLLTDSSMERSGPYLEEEPPRPPAPTAGQHTGGEDAVRRLAPIIDLRTSWVYSAPRQELLKTICAGRRARRIAGVATRSVRQPGAAVAEVTQFSLQRTSTPQITGSRAAPTLCDAGETSWHGFCECQRPPPVRAARAPTLNCAR